MPHLDNKKRKPKGTRISLKRRNKAERETSRHNKPVSSGSLDRTQKRVSKINLKRATKAIKKGNVREVSTTRQVSPAREEIVTPASQRTITSTKFVPKEVRAGHSQPFGKEAPKGTTPSTVGNSRSARLQRALAKGRAEKKTTIMFEGQKFAAGETVTTSKKVNIPAITKKVPAVTETSTKKVPQFKRATPKRKSRTRRRFFATATPINARVQKVSVTQGKKKPKR